MSRPRKSTVIGIGLALRWAITPQVTEQGWPPGLTGLVAGILSSLWQWGFAVRLVALLLTGYEKAACTSAQEG
jgi:hypothetical protein